MPDRASTWERAYAMTTGAVTRGAELASRVKPDLRERLGNTGWRARGERPLWCHAASVGEIASLAPLVEAMTERWPEMVWGVTTTTVTGRDRARERLPGARFHELLPLDSIRAASRAVSRISPGAMLIVETEVWPGILRVLRERRVPVSLASGRLTESGLASFRRWRALFAPAMSAFDLIAARTPEDRARFLALGADADRTLVLGNTKLDERPPAIPRATADRFRRFRGERPLVVWGCLRSRDLPIAIGCAGAVRHPCRWVFVPRHPERFDSHARTLRESLSPLRVRRWTEPEGEADVLVVDAMGVLGAAYAQAAIAVVGGTFHEYGGHSVIEPATGGSPVLFGPDTSSWPEDATRLLSSGGGRRVATASELAAGIDAWLGDGAARHAAGEAARAASREGRGASARIVDTLASRGFFGAVTGIAR